MHLHHFDAADFLLNYWQRRPLLIRRAVPDFEPPLDANQLAGLAMEPGIDSRIVLSDRDFEKLDGPFDEGDFDHPGSWTLLVQAVDQYQPDVAALLGLINFLPNWRVDDVMVSYASDGGSVGPHYDNYDVFLLQGEGQREWQLGGFCDASTALRPHRDMRLLVDFEATESYLLNPGDVLYVPPGMAHWGIARGDCTTFSLGLRAPRLKDLLARQVDQALDAMDDDLFYRDAPLPAESRPGEIAPAALQQAQALLNSLLLEHSGDGRWLGEAVTETGARPDCLAAAQTLPGTLLLRPGTRLAWSEDDAGLWVFADGQSWRAASDSLDLLAELCQTRALAPSQLEILLQLPQNRELIAELLRHECAYYE